MQLQIPPPNSLSNEVSLLSSIKETVKSCSFVIDKLKAASVPLTNILLAGQISNKLIAFNLWNNDLIVIWQMPELNIGSTYQVGDKVSASTQI